MALAILLAGCTSPQVESALPWRLADCSGAAAVFPADGAPLAGRLPSGFRFLTAAEVVEAFTPLPDAGPAPSPPARLSAALVVAGVWCEQAALLDEAARPTALAQVLAFVAPPEDLARAGARTSFLVLDLMISDPELRGRLQAAGLPAVEGAVEVVADEGGQRSTAVDARFRLGPSEFHLEGAAGRPGAKEAGVAFFLPIASGLAMWNGTVTWGPRQDGVGRISIPAGPIREAAGQEAAGEVAVYGEATGAAFRKIR